MPLFSCWRNLALKLGPAVGLLGLAGLAGGCIQPRASRTDRILREVESAPWEDPDGVLVVVNGRPITRGEFYRRILERLGTRELVSGVIKEELFRQEAERRGIQVAEEEAEREAEKVLDDMAERAGGYEKLAEVYEKQGMTVEDLRLDVVRKMKVELLTLNVLVAMRQIDEQVLREYYKQTYGNKRYVTRHVVYGFLPPPDRPDVSRERLRKQAYLKALKAVERLRQGADFETLARTESEDEVTRESGGRLGALTEYSPMPAVLKEAVFSLEAGEISEPVENPRGGYHIFQVTEVLPPEPYVDCVEKMKRELRERRPTPAEISRALEELRSRAEIRFPEGLRAPGSPGGPGKAGDREDESEG
jgi:foldase protein PrsA